MHEWMVDNGFTPHIVVDATHAAAQVPAEHVKEGKIVLNVSHSATRDLVLGNDAVSFEARFGGSPLRISIPIGAVLGIYARETGEGMLFGDATPPTDPATPAPNGDAPRPKLKVVK
jgi:stringent starvation protein B